MINKLRKNKFKTVSRVGGRVGNTPILLPKTVFFKINGDEINITSKLGEVNIIKPNFIDIIIDNDYVILKLNDDSKKHNLAMFGTFRQLLNNHIQGLVTLYEKTLQVNGVGYTCEEVGDQLKLFVGFSHDLMIPKKNNFQYEIINKNTFCIRGINKQEVNNEAYRIRHFKKPNVYDGKGIIFKDEKLILKQKKK